MKKVISMVLIATFLFTGCSVQIAPPPGPEATLKRMEQAFNKNDVEAVLDYLDPSLVSLMQGAVNVLEELSGFGGLGIWDAIPFLSSLSKDVSPNNKLTTKVLSSEINGNEARLYVEFNFGTDSQKDYVDFIKKDGKWYITYDITNLF